MGSWDEISKNFKISARNFESHTQHQKDKIKNVKQTEVIIEYGFLIISSKRHSIKLKQFELY